MVVFDVLRFADDQACDQVDDSSGDSRLDDADFCGDDIVSAPDACSDFCTSTVADSEAPRPPRYSKRRKGRFSETLGVGSARPMSQNSSRVLRSQNGSVDVCIKSVDPSVPRSSEHVAVTARGGVAQNHKQGRRRRCRCSIFCPPSKSEPRRRIELAIDSQGRYIQRDILAQCVSRLLPDSVEYEWDRVCRGTFVEAFAGEGHVCEEVKQLGMPGIAYEAYPGCIDDSGVNATTYDITSQPVLFQLL